VRLAKTWNPLYNSLFFLGAKVIMTEKPLKYTLKKRLDGERRWSRAEPVRDALMRHARKTLKLEKEPAQDWTYATLDQVFPPLGLEPSCAIEGLPQSLTETIQQAIQDDQNEQKERAKEAQNEAERARLIAEAEASAEVADLLRAFEESFEDGAVEGEKEGEAVGDAGLPTERGVTHEAGPEDTLATDMSRTRGAPETPPEGSLTGLGILPPDWPDLPSNASLGAEIQWVQSSRLDVITEHPNGAVEVDLSRARRPAPSKAAIGWLETSIRAYSKYCDIAAKATSSLEDEQEHERRERLAIEEVRSILTSITDPDPA
jgi:hypothetical protein